MRFAPVPAPNAVATPPRATRMRGYGSLVTGPVPGVERGWRDNGGEVHG